MVAVMVVALTSALVEAVEAGVAAVVSKPPWTAT
jgi:hypothetical protein